ncbi:MAG: cyclase family protein [Halieaceae bacterium]|jgi:kynurenine formamidase|nr:putative cyclase [marine gamma proteobacterium HTCC2080]MBT3459607.1 cyclase family protein [Halieaceae bacterium]MDG1492390.1 cyclase family protein [Luminiphilus sp.]MBT4855019.1 cyclase family protein [Halieaceae bacterium]MBT5208491.1 cyclase family protein [Halieaceae bacterium]
MRRFIDLSIYLENDVISDPPMMQPKIEYVTHDAGAEQVKLFFDGLESHELPDSEGWAVEFVQLCTHNGTHLDAPYHYHSTMNGKDGNPERAITIDEVPLEWCFQSGVKLDFRDKADGYVVTAADVEAELARIDHTLKPLEIVLINTAAGEAYGQPDYVSKGCGMGYEATMYLLDRGIRVTGTDAWSWDAPFSYTAERYADDKDASIIWEGHKAGRDVGYCHLEKLHNLEALPTRGFTVSCFPHKVRGGSAGWTRAVAIIDDESEQSD